MLMQIQSLAIILSPSSQVNREKGEIQEERKIIVIDKQNRKGGCLPSHPSRTARRRFFWIISFDLYSGRSSWLKLLSNYKSRMQYQLTMCAPKGDGQQWQLCECGTFGFHSYLAELWNLPGGPWKFLRELSDSSCSKKTTGRRRKRTSESGRSYQLRTESTSHAPRYPFPRRFPKTIW